jgi:hypothetical protein
MSLYDRLMSEGNQFSSEYREKPFDLPEKMFLRSVKAGEGKGDVVKWKGPTKQPFLDLQKAGWRKHEQVLRVGKQAEEPAGDKQKKKKGKTPEGGRAISIHYWQHPTSGERRHFKFTTQSPYVTRTEETVSLFARVFQEARTPEDVEKQDIDILPTTGVRGKVSRERRMAPGMFSKQQKRKSHRAERKAVKQALTTGGRHHPSRPMSAYDL